MIHEISVAALPGVSNIYSVQRRTVWQIADPDTLLIFCAEGRCQVTIDNREYILKKGSMIMIPAAQHYVRRPINNEMCTLCYAHIRFQEDVRTLSVNEAAEFLASKRDVRTREFFYRETVSGNQAHRYLISTLTDLTDHFDKAYTLWREAQAAISEPRSDSATVASIAIVRILLLCALREESFTDLVESAGASKFYLKLRAVVNHIHLHIREPISLDDLCSICNFSKQHLIREFRKEFGETPKVYILRHKINAAKELLYRNPYLSVKEAAAEMGFEDQHYFSRLFKKITGTTPTAYIKHLLTFDPSKQ